MRFRVSHSNHGHTTDLLRLQPEVMGTKCVFSKSFVNDHVAHEIGCSNKALSCVTLGTQTLRHSSLSLPPVRCLARLSVVSPAYQPVSSACQLSRPPVSCFARLSLVSPAWQMSQLSECLSVWSQSMVSGKQACQPLRPPVSCFARLSVGQLSRPPVIWLVLHLPATQTLRHSDTLHTCTSRGQTLRHSDTQTLYTRARAGARHSDTQTH